MLRKQILLLILFSGILLLFTTETQAQSVGRKSLPATPVQTGAELQVSLKTKFDVYHCGNEKLSEQDLIVLLKISGDKLPLKWKHIIGGDFTVIQGEEHSFVVRIPSTELRLKFQPDSTDENGKIKLAYQSIVDIGKEDQFIKFEGERILKLEEPEVVAGTIFRGSSGKKIDTASYALVFSAAIDNIVPVYKEKSVKPVSSANVTSATESAPDNESLTDSEKQTKLELALSYIYQKKYQLAISECEKVLKSDPNNVTAWSRLGSAYFSAGEIDKAKEMWAQALKLEPNNQVLQRFIDRADKLKSR